MPRTSTNPEQSTIGYIAIKHTPEWRDWIERFAREVRLSKQVLCDLALQDFADKHAFERAPIRLNGWK